MKLFRFIYIYNRCDDPPRRTSCVDVLKTLNDLYLRMSEIYNIGKVLYKNTDPAKYADYTFTALLRQAQQQLRQAQQQPRKAQQPTQQP
ncbi:MAG: hypothetical protein QMB37_07195 [Paludibacteraceae bacterium]